ncbi:hypothetical protein GJ496_000171 [Pomphorhynchus laevis]|nr:hypothetical protein GJ496_000171 [Pomphorhynchus laevis]
MSEQVKDGINDCRTIIDEQSLLCAIECDVPSERLANTVIDIDPAMMQHFDDNETDDMEPISKNNDAIVLIDDPILSDTDDEEGILNISSAERKLEDEWNHLSNSRIEQLNVILGRHLKHASEHKLITVLDDGEEASLFANLDALCFNNRRESSNEICECEVVYVPGTALNNNKNCEIRLRYSFPLTANSYCYLRYYGTTREHTDDNPLFSRRCLWVNAPANIHSLLTVLGFVISYRYVIKGRGYTYNRIHITVFKAHAFKKVADSAIVEERPLINSYTMVISALTVNNPKQTITDMIELSGMLGSFRWLTKIPTAFKNWPIQE